MQFRGDFFPFSNMYPLEEWIEADCGVLVPTSEHAYMANRLLDPQLQRAVAMVRDTDHTAGGARAKQLAHEYIQKGAEQAFVTDIERVDLMRSVVTRKVLANKSIELLLLSTRETTIEEGNTWGDTFWGISPPGSGVGANHLGRIYMELRDKLQK